MTNGSSTLLSEEGRGPLAVKRNKEATKRLGFTMMDSLDARMSPSSGAIVPVCAAWAKCIPSFCVLW